MKVLVIATESSDWNYSNLTRFRFDCRNLSFGTTDSMAWKEAPEA